jgi:predicted nucleic acid-binding protein
VSSLLFADNTALVNFCLVGELRLLETVLSGRGAWTATVEIECAESAEYPGLSDLTSVPAFMGEPYAPESSAEIAAVAATREFLRVPGDGPEKHLGEAETIAIIDMRSLTAIVVTDDTGAIRVAGRVGIPVVTTARLLELAVKRNLVTVQRAWDIICELRDEHDRYLPGASTTFADHCMRCGVI